MDCYESKKISECYPNNNYPYSYHSFLYPFAYTDDFIEVNNNSDYVEVKIGGVSHFVKSFIDNDTTLKWSEDKNYREEDIWAYNEYQYFFQKARNNLFNNSARESVHLDLFNKRPGLYFGIYEIVDKNGESYKLWINNIRLSLYTKQKIGILTLEMEYFPRKDQNEKRFHCANIINDLGRRVYAPSVNYARDKKDELTSNYMTADKITIQRFSLFSGGRYCIDKEEIVFPAIEGDDKELSYKPRLQLINYFLSINSENNATISQEDISIKSISDILDDRMFTACLIRDDRISKYNISRLMTDEKYSSYRKSQAKEIYRFIFLDGADSTCQSERMLKEKFRNHLYDRWIDYGTFHGVTEYSLVCATGETPTIMNNVIMPFLVMYVDMAKLALVQRAEIVQIENKVAEITKSIEGKDLDEDAISAIRELWKEYVFFESEVYLPEVTFQEQGVEIYGMLKESLKIDTLLARINKGMDNLNNLAQLASEEIENEGTKKLEKSLNLLTVVGFTLALFSAGQDFFGNIDLGLKPGFFSMSCYYAVSFIILGVVSFVISHGLNKLTDNKKVTENHLNKDKVKRIRRRAWECSIWLLVSFIVWAVYALLYRYPDVKDLITYITSYISK